MKCLAICLLLLVEPSVAWIPVARPHTVKPLLVAIEDLAAAMDEDESSFAASSHRVDAAHQAIDDLTDAFLADGMNVDDFLAAIETQVDNIEKEAPQQQRGAHAAEQVVAVAKEGAAVLIQGVTAVAKETAELAETLPSTKVGHHESSVTYGQAVDKMGKGAQGIWKLASALGGFVKDTVEHQVMEAREAAKQAKLMELQLEGSAEELEVEEEEMAVLEEEEEEELREEEPQMKMFWW